MTALSPRLGQYWTEMGKQILCVLSFFLSPFSTFAAVITVTTLFWLLDYFAPHIKYFIGVIFSTNSQR